MPDIYKDFYMGLSKEELVEVIRKREDALDKYMVKEKQQKFGDLVENVDYVVSSTGKTFFIRKPANKF